MLSWFVLDVFVCYSPSDRELAATIGARLERRAEATVWLEECDQNGERTVAAVWERGLSSAAILLLLSPGAVPERVSRQGWEAVLDHVEGGATPPVGSVLVAGCPYPKLLERRHFFRWCDDPRESLRAIERWVMKLHQRSGQPPFVPARLPWFQGREPELEMMWEALADDAGVLVLANAEPGNGKTSLAQEFARAASGHFRDILWMECGSRAQTSVAGELASKLGVSVEASLEVLQNDRLLLVLDDVGGEMPLLTPGDERTSVLITTRSSGLSAPNGRVIQIEGGAYPAPAEQPSDPADRSLSKAASVCRRQGFPLELAARIADLDHGAASSASERLVAGRWIDPIDAAGTRFRHRATVARREAGHEGARRRHAEVLIEAFSEWRTQPERCKEFQTEMEAALEWALRWDWSLAKGLAERAVAFLKDQGRWPEVARIYDQLQPAAVASQDTRVAENCAWELSWIRDEDGGVRSPAAGDQLGFDFK